jgi:hypothetical protein
MIPKWHNDFRTPSVFSRVEKLKFLVRKLQPSNRHRDVKFGTLQNGGLFVFALAT